MTQPPSSGSPQGPQPTSREKMRDAVDQLMKQVADKKQENKAEVVAARERKARTGRLRWLQAGVLAVGLVISVMFAIPLWRQPFKPPAGPEAERDARHGIVFAARLIEQRIRATGKAPQNFDQVGVPLPGINYMRLDSLNYVISSTVGTRTITFRRGDDLARFAVTP